MARHLAVQPISIHQEDTSAVETFVDVRLPGNRMRPAPGQVGFRRENGNEKLPGPFQDARGLAKNVLLLVLQSLSGDFVSSAVVSLLAVACLDYFIVDKLFSLRVRVVRFDLSGSIQDQFMFC